MGLPNVTLDFCQQKEVTPGEGETVLSMLPISVWVVTSVLLTVQMVSRYVHALVSIVE